MVVYTPLAFMAICAFLPSAISFAIPESSSKSLATRDNKYGLKCANAPSVRAGDFLDPAAVTKPLPITLPASGSDKQWLGNLWCTPGTNTYMFFNTGAMIPPSYQYTNYPGAVQHAIEQVDDYLKKNEDGPLPDPGYWTTSPAGTNVKIGVKDSKGRMTYGILGSALTGFSQFLGRGYDGDDHAANPIVFQVNDGEWGEVGIGYMGEVHPIDGTCTYGRHGTTRGDCSEVIAGKVI